MGSIKHLLETIPWFRCASVKLFVLFNLVFSSIFSSLALCSCGSFFIFSNPGAGSPPTCKAFLLHRGDGDDVRYGDDDEGDGDGGDDRGGDGGGDGDDGVIFYLLPMFASMADATRQRGPFSHQIDL